MRQMRFPELTLVAVLAVLVLVAPARAGQDPSFTLDEVLSAPYPTSLVAAAAAERIAWVLNERGVRNLWTAAGPRFTPVGLTSYQDDDGQPLGDLRLTSDGSLLVFVRGGGPNAAGESPNPTSDPAGVEQAIWAVATSGGEPWKLTTGGGPVLSPDGGKVLVARGSQVLEIPLAPPVGSEKAPEPQSLFQARGTLGELCFSPDGDLVAFVSDRGDHRFVGVFDRAAKRITWVDPGVDRDRAPVFSPDGTRLAFLRQPGQRMNELFDITGGHPFAVWVADPATGQARELWHSPGADGGFAQEYPPVALAWAGDERLVFTSEHDGWLHAYAIPTAGGPAVDLTSGESEIESFAVAADGATLIFAGNRDDPHRRHLWQVPTSGGPGVLLTPGDGIETHPVPLVGGRWVAFRGADARRPQAVSLVETATRDRRVVAPEKLPERFPETALVPPQAVSFAAEDGLLIHGQLFLPPNARPGDRRPAVVFMHGGPIRQMILGWHYSDYYAHCYAFNQYLAARGTVVVAVNFRSGIGFSRGFRQAADQGPRGASEYRDIIAAGRFLAGRREVDPARIGLWGGSYGGYLTALGLARDSNLFAAGVDLHGVHDWAYRAQHYSPGGAWGLTGDDALDRARRSSPIADLASWRSPVLFIHGDDDRNVQFIQTTHLVQELRARGVHVETLIFPDEVHGFLRHQSWLRALGAAARFFERFLGT